MGKGNRHRKGSSFSREYSRGHDRIVEDDGGKAQEKRQFGAPISQSPSLPDHSDECQAAVRATTDAFPEYEKAKNRVAAECPDFAEFERVSAMFFKLKKVVGKHPAFIDFKEKKEHFSGMLNSRDKAKCGCPRCRTTDPRIKAMVAAQQRSRPVTPAAVMGPNGVGCATAASAVPAEAPEAPPEATGQGA